MKTIAVIASCDTKYQEAMFLRKCLEKMGARALVIDTSIGLGEPRGADISRQEVLMNAGADWEDVKGRTKGQLVELMSEAVKTTVSKVYLEGRIDGVLAVGGVQNTVMATGAMRLLPIGFPKVMATTIACGAKPFGPVVGDKDVVVIPSISDFTGVNIVTRAIMENACACVVGMAQYAGRTLAKGERPVVGITLMGVTNDGACAAVEELSRMGIEAVGFHSTGVGGRIMEQLAGQGLLDGILDLTTHEITAEYFGGGFSCGGKDRLISSASGGIPVVVSTGGLDFVDFAKSEFPPRMNERIYNMHNATLAHIKILPDEAVEIGRLFAARLNGFEKGVRLLLPTEGMRKNTRLGENLCCTQVDDLLLKTILDNIGENVRVKQIPGNLNDKEWGRQAAREMVDELRLRGVLPQDGKEA